MNNGMIKSVLKKNWLIISLTTMLISSIGLIAWARYVDANNSMKRTIVSLAETDEKRFTSNLLTRTESPSPKTYPVSNSSLEGDYYKMQVIVRNYTPTDTQHFYDKDINYSFTAELVNVGGTAITDPAKAALVRYGTTGTEFTSSGGKYVVNATGTLSKDQNGTHDITYTFYFHKDLLDATDNVFVKIAATPTADDDDNTIRADVGSLQGIVGISRQAAEIVKTWSGTFSDEGAAVNAQGNHDVEASAYDGFNYIIQGNGARKVSLTWNNTILELNPFSIDELKAVSDLIDEDAWSKTTSGNYTTIVFKVDSSFNVNTSSDDPEDAKYYSRYDVQFYMKGTELASWDTVTGAVTFSPSVTN